MILELIASLKMQGCSRLPVEGKYALPVSFEWHEALTRYNISNRRPANGARKVQELLVASAALSLRTGRQAAQKREHD